MGMWNYICVFSSLTHKINLWLLKPAPSMSLVSGALGEAGYFPPTPISNTGREAASTLAHAFTPSFTQPIHVKDLHATGWPWHRKVYSLGCDTFQLSTFYQMYSPACMGTHPCPPLLQ